MLCIFVVPRALNSVSQLSCIAKYEIHEKRRQHQQQTEDELRFELSYGCSMSFCLLHKLFLENVERDIKLKSSQVKSKPKPSEKKNKLHMTNTPTVAEPIDFLYSLSHSLATASAGT